ncbi:segregation/condensation protein A [Salinirubrum litoreum]|uniref:Segregation/condensation protein A n=1 Tax=Salinirubrum litoreum TaxID=1126234 RepID=A0ABD5R6R8_9EURY|nr:segregation/condensation protein A [Salinirubrum litoreum]
MTEPPETLAAAGVDPDAAVGVEAGDGEGDEEVEPVELLVTLAEEGEIEPWDIDIVAVTDAFLDRLDATDLRTSGRALFYASVLLRMKSDALLSDDDEAEEPEAEPWELAMQGGPGGDGGAGGPGGADGDPGFDPVDALEDEMDRRLERKSARGNPETLDELVRELREAERGSWWKERREYDTSESPKGFSRGTQTLDYHSADDLRRDEEPTEGDVTGTTHKEDIEETISHVQRSLREQYDQGRNEVLFAEVRDVGGTVVATFLALLFLSHRGHVLLQQDDLFGDLWIRNPAVDWSDEEAADGDEASAGEEETTPAETGESAVVAETDDD